MSENKQKTGKRDEFDEFAKLTESVLSVPHSEIKQRLEAEKKAKRRKKVKRLSASRERV